MPIHSAPCLSSSTEVAKLRASGPEAASGVNRLSLNRVTPPPSVPIQIVPSCPSEIDQTTFDVRPSAVVKVVNTPSVRRVTPPPDVPIHRFSWLSSKSARMWMWRISLNDG